MKGCLEKYRNISVWLSLFILAMWFVGASDQENRMPCMLLAFLAGAGIFGSGAAREWTMDNRLGSLIYAVLTGFMWAQSYWPALVWGEYYESRIIEDPAGGRRLCVRSAAL